MPNIEVLIVEHAKENKPYNEIAATIGKTDEKGMVTWFNPSLGKHEIILKNESYSQSLDLEVKSSKTETYTLKWKY